jgi:membrane-bound metal-dependent hydrolase YbcI (DUF457 family)
MMGRSHGVSGIAAGFGLGAVVHATPTACFMMAGVSMVGSYIPDLDCRSSTASRYVPILGPAVSWILRSLSRHVYAATKGPRDEPWSGEHRHLTHTLLWAVGFGTLVGILVAVVANRFGLDGAQLGWLVGLSMAVGCFTHCLGDSLTLMGCPFLFPLPIAGETWWEFHIIGPLSFRTGGVFEQYIVFPALCASVVLLTPGVTPFLLELVT